MKSFRNLLIFILILFSIEQSSAQTKYTDGIDTLKFRNTMSYRDIILPRDYYNIETNKSRFSERLFENPLYGFDIVSFYSNEINNLNVNSFEPFLGHVFADLGISKPDISELNAMMPRLMLNDMLGVNLDSVFGSLGGIIMSKYITIYIVGRTILEKRLNSIDFNTLAFMMNYADSIIYNPTLDADDLFEYKKKNAAFREIAAQFYKNKWVLDSLQTMSAGISILREIIKTNDVVKSNFVGADNQIKSAIIDTKYGKFALGGTGKDTYKGDFALIVDLGGDDNYELEVKDKLSNITNPLRLIIDFNGNDNYKSGDFGLGCGYFGVNAVFDLNGNDKYQAGNYSLGCGIFGLGAVFDYSGDDVYKSGSFSQASAFFGLGFMKDDSGNDTYNAQHFSQAFAGPKAFAFLNDKSGNDKYISNVKADEASYSQAVALGMPRFTGGGLAFLVDIKGDDTYKSTSCSQAFSSWYSVAALIDSEGDDNYSAETFSQSVAVNTSHAILIDNGGDNEFNSKSQSQAFAYDLSFSALIANGNSILKSSRRIEDSVFGVSLLLNNSNSSDSTIYTFTKHNKAENMHSQVLSSGITCKLEYDNNNTSHMPKIELMSLPIMSFKLKQRNFKEPKLNNNLSDLISIATNERLPTQMRESAIDAMIDDTTITLKAFGLLLADNSENSIPLLQRFTNQFDAKLFISLLEDSLHSVNQNTVINSAKMIVELNNSKSFDKIAEQHSNVNWIVRIHIAENIGKFNSGNYSIILRLLLEDYQPYVRAAAAKSLAISDPKPENLAGALNDSIFIVRKAVINGLNSHPKLDIKLFNQLLPLCQSYNSAALLANIFPKIELKKKDLKIIEKTIAEAPHNFIKALYYNPGLVPDEKVYAIVSKRIAEINNSTEAPNAE
ncbi:MAG: HEAT repeat domain-containing protein [Desulfobulbaceae bacterium]|nr:HEAT repeat domain-containing protein [Desulfobulbaceae bacterium]